jgi:Flp pilus assembly protein TadD
VLQRAVNSGPSDSVAHGLLGIAYEKSSQQDKANAEFQLGQQLDPDFANTKRQLEEQLGSPD